MFCSPITVRPHCCSSNFPRGCTIMSGSSGRRLRQGGPYRGETRTRSRCSDTHGFRSLMTLVRSYTQAPARSPRLLSTLYSFFPSLFLAARTVLHFTHWAYIRGRGRARTLATEDRREATAKAPWVCSRRLQRRQRRR